MIRITKSETAPASLSTIKGYSCEDVLKQLLTDQHKKCYLCERILVTDFEVEHLLSVAHHPELAQSWKNLHLACRYCNGRKSDVIEHLLIPTEENIEDELKQEIDFPNNMALFTPVKEGICHQETANLLRKLFNGKNGLRKTKEGEFFKYAIGVINRFLHLVEEYAIHPNQETENAVKNELAISQEFLGFKYWIVKSNPVLVEKFANCIIWNKK